LKGPSHAKGKVHATKSIMRFAGRWLRYCFTFSIAYGTIESGQLWRRLDDEGGVAPETLSGDTPEVNSTDDVSVEIPLESFQLLYTTRSETDSIAFEQGSMDRMKLLEVTRMHLDDCFQDVPTFEKLALFFSVRSKELEMFTNDTRVAFGGSMFFSTQPMPDSVLQFSKDVYWCFLATNETQYVEELQMEGGWEVVQRAVVMTIGGDVVQYADGNIIMPEPEDIIRQTNSMDEDTSIMMILLAVLIPLSVVCVLVLIWVYFKLRNSLLCHSSPKRADAENPMWSTDHPQSVAVRRASTMPWHQQYQETIPRSVYDHRLHTEDFTDPPTEQESVKGVALDPTNHFYKQKHPMPQP